MLWRRNPTVGVDPQAEKEQDAKTCEPLTGWFDETEKVVTSVSAKVHSPASRLRCTHRLPFVWASVGLVALGVHVRTHIHCLHTCLICISAAATNPEQAD